ncbi:hypothetical protein BJ508DRAFT_374638 [Ascobolus immersus RN42]|uniref:Uncharacterized protein n=1 Tax=Ascobolus immersus RN42 TaxID=1160509 RepID=A0A3N4ID48_ASCIM|nr:hypothetical protein BJ508DRAFT_374638 [Ascobolus immersus RN42]
MKDPLPIEVLFHIFSFLHTCRSPCGRTHCTGDTGELYWKDNAPVVQTLRSLALTSRYLNRIFTPLLYKSVVPRDEKAVALLLRTLHEAPWLGEYVRSVGFFEKFLPGRSCGVEGERGRGAGEAAYVSMGRGVVEAVRAQFGIGPQPFIGEDASRGQTSLGDTWLWCWMVPPSPFLSPSPTNPLPNQTLYFLPHLRTLEICPPDASKMEDDLATAWFDPYIPHGYSAPRAFSSLVSIAIYSESKSPRGYALSGEILFNVLRLPRLKKLEMVKVNLDRLTVPPYRSVHLGENLTRLVWFHMEEAFCDPGTLFEIFRRAPRLRRVLIQFNRASFFDEEEEMIYGRLDEPISLLRDSVEELSIKMDRSAKGNCVWIGDLSGFSRLRSLLLDVDFWTLPEGMVGSRRTAAEYLPGGLQGLGIWDGVHGKWLFEGPYEWRWDRQRLPTIIGCQSPVSVQE